MARLLHLFHRRQYLDLLVLLRFLHQGPNWHGETPSPLSSAAISRPPCPPAISSPGSQLAWRDSFTSFIGGNISTSLSSCDFFTRVPIGMARLLHLFHRRQYLDLLVLLRFL